MENEIIQDQNSSNGIIQTGTMPHYSFPDKKSQVLQDTIFAKVESGQRLSFDEGLYLLNEAPFHWLGSLAHFRRLQMNGTNAYFVRNYHIDYTNVCILDCHFCAFKRNDGDSDAYFISKDKLIEQVRKEYEKRGLTEVHLVGGLSTKIPYQYYLDVIAGVVAISPDITMKAFTAVEIDFIARFHKKDLKTMLSDFKNAGLYSLTGGGAEIFNIEVHDQIFKKKMTGERWKLVQKTAHQVGIKTNATMMFGHIEKPEHRIEHMVALRELQDETLGINCFIPLKFIPDNTPMALSGVCTQATSEQDILRTIAVSRLMLDNIPHIKAYWVILGESLTRVALNFGADDIDGTLVEEKIYATNNRVSKNIMTGERMTQIIIKEGFTPIERNGRYERVIRH